MKKINSLKKIEEFIYKTIYEMSLEAGVPKSKSEYIAQDAVTDWKQCRYPKTSAIYKQAQIKIARELKNA